MQHMLDSVEPVTLGAQTLGPRLDRGEALEAARLAG
jgi:hypothetical protein